MPARAPISPHAALLLLGDGRLPTGGHTQSGGLEPAIDAGLDVRAVPRLLATRLRTSIAVDAATAALTARLAAGEQGSIGSDDLLEGVHAGWQARVPSEAVRAASAEAGRGYLRLLAHLGGHVPPGPRDDHRRMPRPMAVGLLAAHLGIAPTGVARLVCHDEVQAVCAAALKLDPVDPAITVVWALEAGPAIEQVVARAAAVTTPDELPAGTAPAAEHWQHTHARSHRRLFRA